MSVRAKLYTLTVILFGGLLGAWLLSSFPSEQKFALVVAAVIASALQIFKAEGATTRASFNLSWIVYAVVFLQYGMSGTFAVILAAHLAEWVWYRYPWYVQTFNIASFAIVVVASTFVARLSLAFFGATSFSQVLSTIIALLVFTAGNHLIVGKAIKLERSQSQIRAVQREPSVGAPGISDGFWVAVPRRQRCVSLDGQSVHGRIPVCGRLFAPSCAAGSGIGARSISRSEDGSLQRGVLESTTAQRIDAVAKSGPTALRGDGRPGYVARDQQYVWPYRRRCGHQEGCADTQSAWLGIRIQSHASAARSIRS